jgi:uncharacterized protein (TIGR02145 family)
MRKFRDMRKKTIFRMLALLLLSATNVNAQVTIGSTNDPHVAAGLDLSPLNKQGLLLPNMELGSSATDFALMDDATDGQKAAVSGLIVFNNKANVLDGKGLYVWDGTKWQTIAMAPATVVADPLGNVYPIALFGEAGWWMTQNLRTITTDLTENSAPTYQLKCYWYPNDDKSILTEHPEYGLLYTWEAAANRTSNDSMGDEGNIDHDAHQGICPEGWHLPSDYEWSQLEKEIATNPGKYSSQTTPYANANDYNYAETFVRPTFNSNDETDWGRQMKSTTTVNSKPTGGTSKSRTANGFDALLVGFKASEYGISTNFWTSSHFLTSESICQAWCRGLDNELSMSGVYRLVPKTTDMFSVRCKKNE